MRKNQRGSCDSYRSTRDREAEVRSSFFFNSHCLACALFLPFLLGIDRMLSFCLLLHAVHGPFVRENAAAAFPPQRRAALALGRPCRRRQRRWRNSSSCALEPLKLLAVRAATNRPCTRWPWWHRGTAAAPARAARLSARARSSNSAAHSTVSRLLAASTRERAAARDSPLFIVIQKAFSFTI